MGFLTTWARRKILPKGKVAEMPKIKKYAFVLDAKRKQIDPTIEQNAWRVTLPQCIPTKTS